MPDAERPDQPPDPARPSRPDPAHPRRPDPAHPLRPDLAPPPRPDLAPPAPVAHWFPPPPRPLPPPRRRPGREVARRTARWVAASVAVLVVAMTFVADVPGADLPRDVLITDDHSGDTYHRADGVSNAVTDLCGSSRLPQQEPSVAVDPADPNVIAVGANDACGARFGSHWAGFYRSTDGGRTWSRSLVPGFVQDTSGQGARSPAHGHCDLASDPVLSFDRSGVLFYGFLCAGERRLSPGKIYVARYEEDGALYAGTVGIPSSNSNGFEDKPALTVDTSGGDHDGSVYAAWTDFTTFNGRLELCEGVLFSRSTDHGHTFQPSTDISRRVCATFADVAVGPGGGVYVTFRSNLKVWITFSLDGGATFSKPNPIANIHPFAGDQFEISTRECGDGPSHCANGRTFPRSDTNPSVAVDGSGVHVVWTALDPVGRGRVYVKSSPNGTRWNVAAVQVHPEITGHQWMPDIAAGGGHLDVVFLDSRDDPAFAPHLPPGETWHGRSSGDVVQTYLERSTDGGVTWAEQRLSVHGSNPNWEVEDAGRVPFYGDYLSISLAGGSGFAAWPDSRDVVPGVDSREDVDADDGDRGFDVLLPCPWNPDDIDAQSYSLAFDTCLTAGGLDLNVYGASFDP